MNQYTVQMVGEPQAEQPQHAVEAHSPWSAVEQVARCNFEDIGLPIWRRGPRFNGTWDVECYMPRDDTGRQWLVSQG